MTSPSHQDVAAVTALRDPGEADRDLQTNVDRGVIRVSNLIAWVFPLLMLAIVLQVVLRAAGHNQAWLDDLHWWLYGFAALAGVGYAVTTNAHVRVDIFHQSFSAATKARVEIMGLGWFLLPFLALSADQMFHYAWSSVVSGEGSDSPNGLHRLYLLKLSLPILFLLAVVASVSMVWRNLKVLLTPQLWTLLLAMAPFTWFVAERAVYYVMWWALRLSQPDVNPRAIGRDPLLADAAFYGLGLVVAIIAANIVLRRTRTKNT